MASVSMGDAPSNEGGCGGWREHAFSKAVTFTQCKTSDPVMPAVLVF